MSTDLVIQPQAQPYEITVSPKRFEIMAQTQAAVVAFIQNQLKPNHDFGQIPGCGDKFVLLQPGIQKIMTLMQVYADPDVTITELGNNHREYIVKTRLKHVRPDGVEITVATGPGSCSTRESKYAYRNASGEDTGKAVPQSYWAAKKANNMAKAQEALGGRGFSARKNANDRWTIHKASSEKVDNPDIADTYNTVLKIAIKRANMAATLNLIGGWSDHFVQDAPDDATASSGPPQGITTAGIREEYRKWPKEAQDVFTSTLEALKAEGLTEDDAVYQAYAKVLST